MAKTPKTTNKSSVPAATKKTLPKTAAKKQSVKRKLPIVWMYQPHTFEVVTGERLKQWESDMKEHVGLGSVLNPDARVPVFIGSGTCSYSHSGPKDSAPDDGDSD